MYRFFGENDAYTLFNVISYYAIMISSIFLFKSKRKSMGIWSKYAINFASRFHKIFAVIVEFVFASAESLLFAYLLDISARTNRPFGEMVNTGANYFGLLTVFPILWFVLSIVLVSNPLKQIDTVTILVPIQLFFIKLACFFNGCCWGIEWEYGFYNCHPDHPGKQVPVQAIEAFWALAIFVFFLWYRKKAKRGTMYPMYVILFCATRFCSEFFRREENVVWIFKTYHLLCIIGFVVGLILFFVMRKYGERLSNFFDKPHIKFEQKVAEYEEKKLKEQIENKTKAEAAEIERKEKVRLARERAKARKK